MVNFIKSVAEFIGYCIMIFFVLAVIKVGVIDEYNHGAPCVKIERSR